MNKKEKEINQARTEQKNREKNVTSWNNFLEIVEELKENPDADPASLAD